MLERYLRNILVVAAHPDDEVLGCGGTIYRHVEAGDRVYVLIMAEGITSRAVVDPDTQMNALHSATKVANAALGVSELMIEALPDNRLDSLDRLSVTTVVERYIRLWNPELVYTHHAGDVNIDHQVVHHAVVTSCRPQPGHPVTTVCFFEVPSSTEWQPLGSGQAFTPNWFVDISGDAIKHKMAALNIYSAEMRDWPHSRSLQAVGHLAGWRGATIGVEAAEAFMLGRGIWPVSN